MSRLNFIIIIVAGLWVFPAYYLTTHEAGHCVSSATLGSLKNDLYLGCSSRTNPFLWKRSLSSSASVTVCSLSSYSFAFQKGFCSYQFSARREISLEPKQKIWIAVSGSVYGFLASYFLFVLFFFFASFFLKKKESIKTIFLKPFHLLNVVEKTRGDPFEKNFFS